MSAINTVYVTVYCGVEPKYLNLDSIGFPTPSSSNTRLQSLEENGLPYKRPRREPGETSTITSPPVYICSHIIIGGRFNDDDFYVEDSNIDTQGRRGRSVAEYAVARYFAANYPLLKDLNNPVIKLKSTGSTCGTDIFCYKDKHYKIIGDFYSFEIQF